MFGLSFGELLLIAGLGLVVIGPERLPETMRFLTHLFRRLRKQVNEVRADIGREMDLEDAKSVVREFSGMKRDTESAVRRMVHGVTAEVKKVESEVKEAKAEDDPPPPAKQATPAPASWPGRPDPAVAAKAPPPPPPRRGGTRLLELLRDLPKEDEAEVCKLLRELARKSAADDAPRLAG